MHLLPFGRVLRPHPVGDGRCRHEEVEVELALEALADDLHVEEPQEPATEAKPERLRGLRLVEERGIVELQLLEGVAQLRVVVGVGREEPREHHRLHVLVAGQTARRRVGASVVSVSPTRSSDTSLSLGDHVPDLPGRQRLERGHRRAHRPDLLRLEPCAKRHRAHLVPRVEDAVDDADEGEHAAVLVVRRVEDERPGGRRRVA